MLMIQARNSYLTAVSLEKLRHQLSFLTTTIKIKHERENNFRTQSYFDLFQKAATDAVANCFMWIVRFKLIIKSS